MSISRITLLSLLFLTLTSFFILGSFGVDDERVTVSTIGNAEQVVLSAFRNVREAEESGADISGLLERLNVAAEYLASAKICSMRGDDEGEAANALLCVEAAEGVVEDANLLRNSAAWESFKNSRKLIFGSVIGVAVAASLSLFGWKMFKQRYCRRVLKMKPEVREAES